eukprot:PhM_4_TR10579/c0_g1_i1/m.26325
MGCTTSSQSNEYSNHNNNADDRPPSVVHSNNNNNSPHVDHHTLEEVCISKPRIIMDDDAPPATSTSDDGDNNSKKQLSSSDVKSPLAPPAMTQDDDGGGESDASVFIDISAVDATPQAASSVAHPQVGSFAVAARGELAMHTAAPSSHSSSSYQSSGSCDQHLRESVRHHFRAMTLIRWLDGHMPELVPVCYLDDTTAPCALTVGSVAANEDALYEPEIERLWVMIQQRDRDASSSTSTSRTRVRNPLARGGTATGTLRGSSLRRPRALVSTVSSRNVSSSMSRSYHNSPPTHPTKNGMFVQSATW